MKSKIISFFTLILLIAQIILPGISNAVNEKSEDNAQKDVKEENIKAINNDITVEGNGKIGTLLAEQFDKESDNKSSSIYGIVDVKMENNIAYVEYFTQVDAKIIVCIYNQEKTKTITLGSVEVSASEEKAYLELPQNEMPEYYYLKAFMVDEENSPLCKPYSTTLYTEGIQKVVNMTANDFEQDRVLNFDEDENSNFAIYSENTVVIKENESDVKIALADEKNNFYVFENIDDSIKNLQHGNTMVYETADYQEIVIKISKIDINGSKANITGENVTLKDIFDYIKIETDTSDMETEVQEVDDDSIIFEGIENETNENNFGCQEEGNDEILFKDEQESDKEDIGKTIKTNAQFKFIDKKVGGDNANIKLSGNLNFGFSITTNYYFNIYEVDNSYCNIKEAVSLSGKLSITGKIRIPVFTFANFDEKYPRIRKEGEKPIIEIKFSPGLIVEVSAETSFSFTIECSSSQEVTTEGVTYTSTPIKVKTGDQFQVDIQIYIGLDVSPKLEVNVFKKNNDKDEGESTISIGVSMRERC